MSRLTRHEQWMVALLTLILGVGLGTRVWLRTHPQPSLPALPAAAAMR